MKEKGFTLIELLAVLVVLAILALIAIPIVIGIVNDAREKSYQRSIGNYGRTFEKVIALDNINNASRGYRSNLNDYVEEVEKNYSGTRIQCDLDNSRINNGKLTLEGCIPVKEIKTYNKKNRISKYLYLYEDGKVIRQEAYDYVVGDCNKNDTYVTYKNQKWCVIKNSREDEDYVTVMRYYELHDRETNPMSGYGAIHNPDGGYHTYDDGTRLFGIQHWFYSSSTCGYVEAMKINSKVETGCINDYDQSHIKEKVDGYALSYLDLDDLKEINGYRIRLIKKEEMESNLGFINNKATEKTPTWFSQGGCFWTMSKVENTSNKVYVAEYGREIVPVTVYGGDYLVRYGFTRPVINLYKKAIGE